MKLYSTVPHILSAVLFAPNLPNAMGITGLEHADTGAWCVPDHSSDHFVSH